MFLYWLYLWFLLVEVAHVVLCRKVLCALKLLLVREVPLHGRCVALTKPHPYALFLKLWRRKSQKPLVNQPTINSTSNFWLSMKLILMVSWEISHQPLLLSNVVVWLILWKISLTYYRYFAPVISIIVDKWDFVWLRSPGDGLLDPEAYRQALLFILILILILYIIVFQVNYTGV